MVPNLFGYSLVKTEKLDELQKLNVAIAEVATNQAKVDDKLNQILQKISNIASADTACFWKDSEVSDTSKDEDEEDEDESSTTLTAYQTYFAIANMLERLYIEELNRSDTNSDMHNYLKHIREIIYTAMIEWRSKNIKNI